MQISHKQAISDGVKRHLPSSAYKKGQSASPETQFKKGNRPWNMGIYDSDIQYGAPVGHKSYYTGHPIYSDCIICGTSFRTYNCIKNRHLYCSLECRNMGLSRERPDLQGEKSPHWRGGKSREKHTLTSPQYRKWRNAVFQRDSYTCRNCDVFGGRMEAHHIKSFSAFPELRFEVANGETLCYPCHKIFTANMRCQAKK